MQCKYKQNNSSFAALSALTFHYRSNCYDISKYVESEEKKGPYSKFQPLPVITAFIWLYKGTCTPGRIFHNVFFFFFSIEQN